MALFTSQSTAKSTPAAAHPGREAQRQGINIRFDFGPSKKDILNFTNQLAVMVRAGISLQDALESIGSQIPKEKFRAIVLDIKGQIEGGECFSRALARYPDVFGNLYVNMIAAAEISGSMSAMLQQLVAYLDQESETRSQIIGAMVYPAIIATMAVSCVTFLLIFVLPRFLLVFAGKEDLLPIPTKLIMALSGGLRHYWFIIFPAIAAVILGFWYLTHRTDAGKFWWDKIKLRIPLLGTLCRSLYITRSMHTMGVLTNAGVPILDTISITALISGNILYERMWRNVHEAVRQGKKIGASLAEYNLMPSNVVQMIQAGEESGSLGEVLKDIAEFYARQLRTVIKAATSMIEPLMIVMMGVLVGFIAMSIILPIFKMSSVVTSG